MLREVNETHPKLILKRQKLHPAPAVSLHPVPSELACWYWSRYSSSVWFQRRNDKHQINRSTYRPWQECAGLYRKEITNISHRQDAMVSVMFVRSMVGGGSVCLVLVFAATHSEMVLRSVLYNPIRKTKC